MLDYDEYQTTVGALLMDFEKLNKRIESLRIALSQLRPDKDNWENGIEKDTRESVKILWASLQELMYIYNTVCGIEINVGKSLREAMRGDKE